MLNLRSHNHRPLEATSARKSDQADSEPVFSLQEESELAVARSDSPPPSPAVLADSRAAAEENPSERREELPNKAAEPPELLLKPLGFGEELRNLRAEAGLTIPDVAYQARASQELINNLEQEEWGEISVADFYCIACIERLCAVYKVGPDDLLQKFELASRAAGRPFSSGAGFFSASRSGSSDIIFTPEELSGEGAVSHGSRIPALVIALLLLMLLGLLAGGWFVQRSRTAQREDLLQRMEREIPKLIQPQPIPLETLPVPQG